MTPDPNPALNDIDRLMALDPPLTSLDVEAVIAYHREQRQRRAAGERGEKPSLDLAAILHLPKKTTPTVTRRL